MSTRCNIIVRLRDEDLNKEIQAGPSYEYVLKTNSTHPYLCIYIHNDGYLKGVGQHILDNLDTYEKTLRFVLNGDMSSFDDPYIKYKGELWFKHNEPEQLTTIPKKIREDYCYVYEDGEWTYKYKFDEKWKSLRDTLSKINNK